MKTGQTNLDVGTRIKIVGVKGEDKDLNGLTGKATHPYAFGCTDKGWIGVNLDGETPCQDNRCNIMVGQVIVLDE